MSKLPENLQVIKLEPIETPEKSKIKERLNLHVKRRLLQDSSTYGGETLPIDTCASTINKRSKSNFTQSKVQKPRKPYQKRVEKVKEDVNKCKTGKHSLFTLITLLMQLLPPVDLDSFDDLADQEIFPESSETKNIGRERFKNADILNIVLTKKKLALMLNPDVQSLWSKIMSSLKN